VANFYPLSFSFYLGNFEGNVIFFTILFFLAGIYLVFKDIKTVSGTEVFLLFVLFVIIGILFLKALPLINSDNFKGIDFNFFGLPYGVILFSMWGTAIIPEIKEMLIGANKTNVAKILRKVIFVSTFYCRFFFLSVSLFLIILGVLRRKKTSEEAISGIRLFF
jgi:amino acid permease